MSIIQTIRTLNKAKPKLALLKYLQYLEGYDPANFEYCKWQVQDLLKVEENTRFAFRRTRRGSKTRDMSMYSIFKAICGWKVFWRAALGEQLNQSRIYFSLNPFVQEVTRDYVKIRGFRNQTPQEERNRFTLRVIGEGSGRGGECDLLAIDEGGSLVYPYQKDSYYATTKTLASGRNPQFKIIQFSTPKRGSVFEEFCCGVGGVGGIENKGLVSVRTVHECPWIRPEVVEMDREYQPEFWYKQEYLAQWTTAAGAIFHDDQFILCDFDVDEVKKARPNKWWVSGFLPGSDGKIVKYRLPEQVYGGVDFGGESSSGHAYIELSYDEHNLYILRERIFHRTSTLKTYLEERAANGVSIEIESGGYNEGFRDQLRQFKAKAWDGEVESKRLGEATARHIIIDPQRCPRMFRDLQVAAWEERPDGKLKPDKLRGGGLHFLDALLHGIHKPQRIHIFTKPERRGPLTPEELYDTKFDGVMR
jgi:hypothetical protein